jgi:hypothetical protein
MDRYKLLDLPEQAVEEPQRVHRLPEEGMQRTIYVSWDLLYGADLQSAKAN